MTIEQAIKSLENIIEYWDCRPTEQKAAELAITALQEQQERAQGCDHCRGWDKRCGANYCPMCGRKLGEWNG